MNSKAFGRRSGMTQIITRKLARKKGGKSSLVLKRVYKSSGELASVLSVDANSPTFGDDLGAVFSRNVAKARRENKKKFGSPDRVAQKA
jgi:hypothetical protein